MSILERDVVLRGINSSDGRPTRDLPVTRLGNIEDNAEVKESPGENDYLPIVDSTDRQMKKALVSSLTVALGIKTKIFEAGMAPPEDKNLLWIDTTAGSGGLKYYNGSAWVDVPNTALLFGSNGEAGKFDRLSTAPTAMNPLRYNGVFRATKVFGVYYSDSADLAESYAVEGPWQCGDLIAIGGDGLFRRNETPGNRRVLGIVSQRPGMLLGGVEGAPIALAGRVPVRAEGIVRAGDLLIAGDAPGTVRAADPDDAPRGSVVAVALEGKSDPAVGLVLALVQRL